MSPGVWARLRKLNGGNARCARGGPRQPAPGDRGCPHLRLLSASPAGVCGLAGGCPQGLPGGGLREAGLEQEDRREDWLAACVRTEPCEDKAGWWAAPARAPAPQAAPTLRGGGAAGTTYLETCGRHVPRALPVGLPRRRCPGPKERAEGRVPPGSCSPACWWRLEVTAAPTPGSQTSQTLSVLSPFNWPIRNQQLSRTTTLS